MKLIIFLIILSALSPLMVSTSLAQPITSAEAATVATNWMTLIWQKTGDWSGVTSPSLASVEEYKRGNRTLGYFCKVNPSGYILVSLLKGLPPITAYSTTCNLDLNFDEGPGDLIKYWPERVLNQIEKQLGPISTVTPERLRPLLAIDNAETWNMLSQSPANFRTQLENGAIARDYYQGDILLTSEWHQHEPYNNNCPSDPDVCDDPHCTVGCVATAAAQIVRYWSWPPGRDFMSMRDYVYSSDSTQWQAAVAELSSFLGLAVDMNYCENDGCASGAFIVDMEPALEMMSYDPACWVAYRSDYEDPLGWWGLITSELDANQPIEYGIPGHAIVCDGYSSVGGQWNYHMNYGWGGLLDSFNTWYALDNLHYPREGDLSEEKMLLGIKPNFSRGQFGNSTYAGYSYIDRDFWGSNAHFLAGSRIQFLTHPAVAFRCGTYNVRIDGTPSANSKLYAIDETQGIKLTNSSIILYPGGGIQMFRERPGIYGLR